MRVLLIEDDSATAQSIELMLQSEGFNIYTTDLGEEGVDLGKLYDYDIILLDLGLPDMSGYDVLKTLRVAKVQTPILILSGHAGIEDKVRGLGFGADDYLTKPFDLPELEARVRALIRRGQSGGSALLSCGALTLDTSGRRAMLNGEPIEFSARELGVLEVLMMRSGRVVSKEQLAEKLYSWNEEVGANAIEVYIHRLRKKVEPGGVSIRTIRGLGYLLEKPGHAQD